jgi:hypothetical protein
VPDRLQCPSARCEPGALLLGAIGPDGRAAFLPRPWPVDDHFVTRAREGRAPERRLRFASACREGGCLQWADGRCGVVDRVMDLIAPPARAAPPSCAIRGTCRWWAQAGPRACGACRHVVTDLTAQSIAGEPP